MTHSYETSPSKTHPLAHNLPESRATAHIWVVVPLDNSSNFGPALPMPPVAPLSVQFSPPKPPLKACQMTLAQGARTKLRCLLTAKIYGIPNPKFAVIVEERSDAFCYAQAPLDFVSPAENSACTQSRHSLANCGRYGGPPYLPHRIDSVRPIYLDTSVRLVAERLAARWLAPTPPRRAAVTALLQRASCLDNLIRFYIHSLIKYEATLTINSPLFHLLFYPNLLSCFPPGQPAAAPWTAYTYLFLRTQSAAFS